MNLKDKTVLVTGAGGFIGSHLTESLVEKGADVRAFVHYNSLGSYGWLDSSEHLKNIHVIAGDICDRDQVQDAINGIDIVFHLAALVGIPYSYASPVSYIRTNIEGTLNVLQSARRMGVERVLHTSTSEVYGTALEVPITEDHPLKGQSPYSASKIGADKLVEAFYCSFDCPIVTVRPFNTFGPRQSARAVIPTIISQCLSGTDVIQLGNISPTRDMNFVSNTVDGFLAAAVSSNAIGKTINIGSGTEISIGDLVKLIAKITDREIRIESDEKRIRTEKSEVERLLADNKLAYRLTAWEPKIHLEEGLKITIEWMKNNIVLYRPNTYVV